jgi:predicted RecA/RadA family phage recombinase
VSKTLVQKGDTIIITASGAKTAGQFVMVEDLAVVCAVDIADGQSGAAHATQVHEVSAKANVAISQGDNLYWDADGDPVGGTAGSGCLTNVATDNKYAGKAWAAAASGASSVQIKLNA